jgi:hypothetical protein
MARKKARKPIAHKVETKKAEALPKEAAWLCGCEVPAWADVRIPRTGVNDGSVQQAVGWILSNYTKASDPVQVVPKVPKAAGPFQVPLVMALVLYNSIGVLPYLYALEFVRAADFEVEVRHNGVLATPLGAALFASLETAFWLVNTVRVDVRHPVAIPTGEPTTVDKVVEAYPTLTNKNIVLPTLLLKLKTAE